jgi:hypothetical protein
MQNGERNESMSSNQESDFTAKHKAGDRPDEKIAEAIKKRSKDNELPCAVAFAIAKEIGAAGEDVGKTVDLLNFRLVKCQLGLFGYTPEKKIVQPASSPDPALTAAIREAIIDDKLPCALAWDIAERLDVRKMTVSSACEALGIKIKPCQLGAF